MFVERNSKESACVYVRRKPGELLRESGVEFSISVAIETKTSSEARTLSLLKKGL